MQVIRLSRVGRNKYPLYRIVTADKRRAANGKFLTVIGRYNPHTKELVINKEELQTAIEHGAQPSNAVLKLMQKDGIALPKWASVKTRQRAPKKAVEPAEEATSKAEAVADETGAGGDDTKPDVETPTAETEAAETKAPAKGTESTPADLEKAKDAAATEEKVADAAIEVSQDEAAKDTEADAE